MGHGHGHSHDDPGKSEEHGKLSEVERLLKIVEHWIHHNGEHARSYRDWAKRAREMGLEEICLILEEVADATEMQNRNLEEILNLKNTAPSSH